MNAELRKVKQFYREDSGLIYVNNPKAACSSIKYSMLRDPDRIHDMSAFDTIDESVAADRFTVVRDPATRSVSAYLNKVANGKHEDKSGPWAVGRKRFGWPSPDRVSYKRFLECLTKVPDVNELDPHFRPQYLNVRPDKLSYAFIGYFENMDEVAHFLESYRLHMERFSPHKQKTTDMLHVYEDDEVLEMLYEIYRLDFKNFEYSLAKAGTKNDVGAEGSPSEE